MNIQMLEGLLGASSNIKMKQALGYTGECTEKAVEYQEQQHPQNSPSSVITVFFCQQTAVK